MLCDKCNKNEAQFCIIETKDGQKNERYLCSKCAFNKNVSDDDFFQNFINNIISNVVNYYNEQLSEAAEDNNINNNEYKEGKCENCGLSLKEITKLGKVGCSHCYSTFNDALSQIILKLQGSNKHEGKVVQKFEKEIYTVREIGLLKDRLKQKIKEEQYEEAAILRDKIKELERGVI